MANELNIALGTDNTGLTLTGRVRGAGGSQVGSDSSMTETGVTGFYYGDFSLGVVADGVYSVEFLDGGGILIGDGSLLVKDNSEYDLSDLNDFNPSTDTVSNVTTVTTNTDMRGTDGANTTTPNTIVPDNASITAILADTNELQLSQGNWVTATTTISSNMRGTDSALLASSYVVADNATIGDINTAINALNDFNPSTDVVAHVTLVDTTTTNTDMRGTEGSAKPSHIAPLY